MEIRNTTYDGSPINSASGTSENSPRFDESQNLERRGDWFNPIATGVSWIFVPLLMPLYGVLLIFRLSLLNTVPEATQWRYIAMTALICGVLPMILIYLLKAMGFVSDVGLNERKERWLPYLITIVAMLSMAWIFSLRGAPHWVALFFVGGAVSAVVNLVVNFWWKISAHCAGAGGLVALLLYLNLYETVGHSAFWWHIAAIMLAGLLGTSRIWLGRHTLMQVLAGYLCGFLSIWLVVGC